MKKTSSLIALDIGTTTTKGILYSIDDGTLLAGSQSYRSIFPSPGRAEQDPDEVLGAVIQVVRALIDDNDIDPATVSSLVFGGILHSLLPVDRKGNKLCNALTWADTRSTSHSEKLRKTLDIETVRVRTGCSVHPLYFLPRLLWMGEEVPEIFRKTVRFISIKEYILYRLFGSVWVDRSIASGTGMWNVQTMDWDDELMELAHIDKSRFSPVTDTHFILSGLKGEYASQMGLLEGTPCIIGGADGPLAHLGSVGLDDTRMSLTMGTSAAVRKISDKPSVLKGREAWCYYLSENKWLLGGVVHDAGNVIDWFGNNFIPVGPPQEDIFKMLHKSVLSIPPGADGLLFLPFMSGERSPYYNPNARAALIGMNFSHGKEHMLKALVEGLAFRVHTVARMLNPAEDMELILTGGILKSPAWMQITADFLGRKLWMPEVTYASAWGACLVALRALGIIDSLEKIGDYIKIGDAVHFNPDNYRMYRSVCKRYEEYYNRLFS
jgi:gluconokinase